MTNATKYNTLNYLLLVFILVFSASSHSQLREWFKIYADEKDAAYRMDHLCINVNYNNWIHDIDGLETGAFSLGMDIGVFKDIPLNKRGTLGLGIGVNYSFLNIHHNGDISYTFDSTTNENSGTLITPTNASFKKNKFYTNFIEVPIELRIRSIKHPRFRFYLGFKGGYNLSVHATRVTEQTKVRTYRIKNILQYRYGPTVKIGYGKVNLYGFYSLTPLFEEGKGMKITPYTAGLSFFIL